MIMRKLIGILFFLSFLPVVAQENVVGEYMYIYHRDKSVERIDISDIDSITFTVPQIVYEAVDLGLSVKWAACNVGAFSPWESGGYYAWGETEEKEIYDWNTYKYAIGTANGGDKGASSTWIGGAYQSGAYTVTSAASHTIMVARQDNAVMSESDKTYIEANMGYTL